VTLCLKINKMWALGQLSIADLKIKTKKMCSLYGQKKVMKLTCVLVRVLTRIIRMIWLSKSCVPVTWSNFETLMKQWWWWVVVMMWDNDDDQLKPEENGLILYGWQSYATHQTLLAWFDEVEKQNGEWNSAWTVTKRSWREHRKKNVAS